MPRRSLMSDALKWELAQELGVTDTVSSEGWGGVSARNCGNLVKLAIMRAEQAMADDYGRRQAFARQPQRTNPAIEAGVTSADQWGTGPLVHQDGGDEFPGWAQRPDRPDGIRS